MKRMIRASKSVAELWKQYYAEDAVRDRTIRENEINDVLAIKVQPVSL